MIRAHHIFSLWFSPRVVAVVATYVFFMAIAKSALRWVDPVPGVLVFDVLWVAYPLAVILLGAGGLVAGVGVYLVEVVMFPPGWNLALWRILGLVWLGLLADALHDTGGYNVLAEMHPRRRAYIMSGLLIPLLATDAAWQGLAVSCGRLFPWIHVSAWHLVLAGGSTLVLLPLVSGHFLPRWRDEFGAGVWFPDVERPSHSSQSLATCILIGGGGLVAWVGGVLTSLWTYGYSPWETPRLGTGGHGGVWLVVGLGLAIQAVGWGRWFFTRDSRLDSGAHSRDKD